MTDAPRLFGRKEAAAYLGIGESTFSLWVSTHKMPPAIAGTRKWDRRAIDAKLDEISGLGNAAAANDSVENELEKWRRERDARKQKAPPTISLREAPRRVLMFMADHPECDTVDQIPGAGQRTLDKLITVGVVAPNGRDDNGSQRYRVTQVGMKEAAILEQWFAR